MVAFFREYKLTNYPSKKRHNEHGLTLNATKCQINVSELTYMGHVLMSQGLQEKINRHGKVIHKLWNMKNCERVTELWDLFEDFTNIKQKFLVILPALRNLASSWKIHIFLLFERRDSLRNRKWSWRSYGKCFAKSLGTPDMDTIIPIQPYCIMSKAYIQLRGQPLRVGVWH